MRVLDWIYRKASAFFFKQPASRHVEMASVFAELMADARRRGRLAATKHALREFGDLVKWSTTSSLADVRWLQEAMSMKGSVEDLRQSVRALRASPGFALVACCTLGLGIGATAAVLTVAWHLVLKPLPWAEPHRLVQIWNIHRPTGSKNVVAPGNYQDIVADARSFEAVAAYTYMSHSQNLTGSGSPVELRVRAVTGDYFRVFGVPAALGRTLSSADETEDSRAVVVSTGLWTRQFGADPSAIGRTILLDDMPHRIVGVMPSSFDIGARPVEVWIPYVFTPEMRQRRMGYFLGVVARLRQGVTIKAAQGEVGTLGDRASAAFPTSNARIGMSLNPLEDEVIGSNRSAVLLLCAGALIVLLIAATNVTSLLLARGAGRYREVAVRAALGATRGRLLRHFLAEGFLVASAGGLAGLFAGLCGVRLLALSAPPTMLRSAELTADLPIVLGTLLVSFLSGLALTCFPAWQATRPARHMDALRGRGTSNGSHRIRSVLVTSEVALATLLLASSGLLLASMLNVLRVDPGFDPSGVVVADVRLPASRYDSVELRTRFFETVVDRLRSQPNVIAACATNDVPLENETRMTYVPEGTEAPIPALPMTMSPGCFPTLRLRLITGRLFESPEPESVAIVSQAFAQRAFPRGEVIGKSIHIGISSGELLRIVGVVADSRGASLESAPFGQVFEPAAQSKYFMPTRLLVRSTGPPESVVPAMMRAVHDVDPSQPLANVRTLDSVVTGSIAARRFNVTLIASFAGVALVLAGVGLYGLLSQIVRQRESEIGVRLALGATPRAIVLMILQDAASPVAIGVPVGLLGMWAASRLLRGFLFGTTGDPWIIVGVVTVIVATTLISALLPTRRAAVTDPVTALRAE